MTKSNSPKTPKKSIFEALVVALGRGASSQFGRDRVDEIDRGSGEFGFSVEPLSTAPLLGSGAVQARARQAIYAKYQQMLANPLVAGSLRVHVMAALGGHETSGDMVFIEAKPEAQKEPAARALIDELNKDLGELFNRIAPTVAFNGVAYGDSFARLYTARNIGVVNAISDEMMLPPLVQAFEQGEQTVVCQVAVGQKYVDTLAMDQIARLKMPRMIYAPQPMAIEKAWRMRIREDDINALPLMPSLAGGSFLIDAEDQFDKFTAAMLGLVGQRVLDSIDESIMTVNVTGMTKEQRTSFLGSVTRILMRSKELAETAVKSGAYLLGRVRHMLPVYGDKQVMQLQGVNSAGGAGTGRAGNVSVEDVMFHAKLLGGVLGVDVSMLGFADLMSGGLGDGGFFRTSIQAAERSRVIRTALSEFFGHIIDVHLAYKKGVKYEPGSRPWQINFYGSISALETERQRTTADAYNAGALLAQTLTTLKDSGLDDAALSHLLTHVMKMDEADAKLYAKALAKAKADERAREAANEGGFGGVGTHGASEGVDQLEGGTESKEETADAV